MTISVPFDLFNAVLNDLSALRSRSWYEDIHALDKRIHEFDQCRYAVSEKTMTVLPNVPAGGSGGGYGGEASERTESAELHVGEYLLYSAPKGIGIRHRNGEGGVFDSGLFEQKVKEFFGEHF